MQRMRYSDDLRCKGDPRGGERGCDDGDFVFRLRCVVCLLQATRLPEDWKLDGLSVRKTDENVND